MYRSEALCVNSVNPWGDSYIISIIKEFENSGLFFVFCIQAESGTISQNELQLVPIQQSF